MISILQQAPSRNRVYLFALLASIIEADNPHVPAAAVTGSTRPTHAQVAQFEIRLREDGLLADNEQVTYGCVDQVLGPLAR